MVPATASAAPALRLVSATSGGGRPASFWRFEGAPAPGAGKTPILAVAGLGLDGRVFSRLGALARDRDLVLANLPNDLPASSTMTGFGREALAILDAAGHAGRPAILMGSSFGAMAALAAANAAPDRAAGLVLIGGAASWSWVPFRLRAASRLHPWIPRGAYPGFFANVMLPPGGRMAPEVRADLRAQMLHRTKPFLGASIGAMRSFDGLAGPRAFAGPALLLHGERDAVLPARGGRFLADALPGATFVEFPGAGHLPHVSQPARVVEAIEGFLARESL